MAQHMHTLYKNTYHTSADDHSRVVLSERDANGSDYINGVYIDVSDQQHGIQHTYTHTHTILMAFTHTCMHVYMYTHKHACMHTHANTHRPYPQLRTLVRKWIN